MQYCEWNAACLVANTAAAVFIADGVGYAGKVFKSMARTYCSAVALLLGVILTGYPSSSQAAGPAVANSILFVTQVPAPDEFDTATVTNIVTSVVSPSCNHLADTMHAPRGGDLYIYYPDGTWTNLTRLAGYGNGGFQGTNGIAVRQPAVHWSGKKAVFSMVVGAPQSTNDTTQFFWQLYEITNLNKGSLPVITKIPNQPVNYNNVDPTYGTDERIIFASDRPRDGSPFLYPQLDEYNDIPTLTGIWSLDPASGNLFLLNHLPSGGFNPFVDSFGRLIMTRWDHLVQDSNAMKDRQGSTTNGTFNYADETANAAYILTNRAEIFPEPHDGDTNILDQLKVNQNSFNLFLPWQLTEDGMSEETLNHVGRHELSFSIQNSFTNDPNLVNLTNALVGRFNSNYISGGFFQIREDPTRPGTYFGIDGLGFGTHASGQILTLTGPLAGAGVTNQATNPDFMYVTYITPKNTFFSNSVGNYRNPLPMSDGKIIAARSTSTQFATNQGTVAFPKSPFDFRLTIMQKSGNFYVSGTLLTPGLTNGVTFYRGNTLVTYTNLLWELDPVEVRSVVKPARYSVPIAAVEQQVFAEEGVDVSKLQAFLRANNLALIVSRNVTTRDHADRQQPYNLHIAGTATQTLGTNPPSPGNVKIYDISHIQFFEADQVRGLTGGGSTPLPGRRVLPTPLNYPMADNVPFTNGAPGSVKLGTDGSMAAFVPARRAMSWQLMDPNTNSVVRERYWITFAPGEIRTCTSCHGINETDQAGHVAPTNEPLALHSLLKYWKAKYTPQVLVTNINNTNYLAITFNRLTAATNLTHTVEVSSDLKNWISGSVYAGTNITPNTAVTTEVSRGGAITETIVVRDNAPLGFQSRHYMRVRVTSP